ncbi:MAG: hypothetical protein JNK79_00150 [Chitinophagaceae bacterium]|nr:hypothetical protein [Chitinophagaceae bacterium]
MKVTDRLQEYLNLRNISPYTFERTCGIANGYLKKQMKGKGSIGSEIVERITEKYKDLNVTWLLTGKGNMLITNYPVNEQVYSMADKEQEYTRHEQTVKSLREKILILENALADKEKIIKLLEKQASGQ